VYILKSLKRVAFVVFICAFGVWRAASLQAIGWECDGNQYQAYWNEEYLQCNSSYWDGQCDQACGGCFQDYAHSGSGCQYEGQGAGVWCNCGS
jgi:hypothetical protein